MTTCPKCGHEFEPDEKPSAPLDEPVEGGQEMEPSSDASLYLLHKEKRRRTLFVGGVSGGILVLFLIIAMAFWIWGSGDKPKKLVKKIEREKTAGLDKPDISSALEALLKVRNIAVPAAAFSDYSREVNNAMIELNALPTETARVERLRAIAQYYQAAKDIWIGTILIESTPLANLEEKTLSALSLLNLIDPVNGNCRKELDKTDGALCASFGAFHVWKQKGTYVSKDDKVRIRERLDPLRLQLWKRASEQLDSFEP